MVRSNKGSGIAEQIRKGTARKELAPVEATLELLTDILKYDSLNPLLFLVLYGSLAPDGDIDLLAVFEYPPTSDKPSIGRLDIHALSKAQFLHLLERHDIIVTEPLLVGKLLIGDTSSWTEVKQRYLETPPGVESVYYLIDRSMEAARFASVFLSRYLQTQSPVDRAAFWSNLAFATGYLEFALRYYEGSFPVTYGEVLSSSATFADLIQRAKLAKRGRTRDLCMDAMEEAMNAFRRFLLDRRPKEEEYGSR